MKWYFCRITGSKFGRARVRSLQNLLAWRGGKCGAGEPQSWDYPPHLSPGRTGSEGGAQAHFYFCFQIGSESAQNERGFGQTPWGRVGPPQEKSKGVVVRLLFHILVCRLPFLCLNPREKPWPGSPKAWCAECEMWVKWNTYIFHGFECIPATD